MTHDPRSKAVTGKRPDLAAEPFRVFFPLGIAAAIFGLLLWPLHYIGWWPNYPAIQHPRILIFGFGAAFLFGFMGTAWPRFLEVKPISRLELGILLAGWSVSQLFYAKGDIQNGDFVAGIACGAFLVMLGKRLLSREIKDMPPPGFILAFVAVMLGTITLFCWVFGFENDSPQWFHLFRLTAYQGFLLLPLMGVGAYLFPRFFQLSGKLSHQSGRRTGMLLWVAALILCASFVVEAFLSARYGNLLRLGGYLVWAVGTVPTLWTVKAPGTRPWALRMGLCLIAVGFLCRAIWPLQLFAFEHLLFLCGFGMVMLLTADRVIIGHCAPAGTTSPRSKTWRWIAWLMVISAATRAVADMIPSTRVSHHIYAALMVIIVLVIWSVHHFNHFRQVPPSE